VVLGTVIIDVTRKPAIDAAPALTRKAGHAVEERIAARRSLDATLVLTRYVDAHTPWGAHIAGYTGAAATEDAVFDRRALEAVAPRLDAYESDGAVVSRAKPCARTGTA
jgi:hypothetical protein